MKILFIACYSPLINNSAAIETLQYLNNLVKEGNEIHLLTVNFPKDSIYYDENIFKMLDKRVKLHIVTGGKLFERVMPRKSSNSSQRRVKESYIKGILKSIKKSLAIPDMYLIWANNAASYGIKLMEEERFDVMFSMHEPPSSHICALKIKEKFVHIPWVTYWSDPWLKDSTREDIGTVRRKIESNWEKKIVNLTDRLIFVTEANRQDYIKSYNVPVEKTFVITRGYDAELYKETLKRGLPEKLYKNKVNFVYAGEIFSKLRDVRPFIKALDGLKEKNLELYNKLNILFFGNVDDLTIENELKDNEKIQLSGRIPYSDALAYILNAEVLIIFGNKNSKQIPAKIYDYYGANGKILVVLGDKDDPIKDVINDKCVIVENETDLIENAIANLVESVKNGEITGPDEEYEWSNISKKLNNILKGAI